MARENSGKQAGAAKLAKNGNGANLGFEAQLFLAADKLRGNLEPSDYKHVALGLIFLKYISDAFEAKRAALLADDPNSAEDPDEYLAENVFWVPKDARWTSLQANAKQPTIGKLIDDAMLAIETKNASLTGVLPKDYNRPALNKIMLGELIDLVSSIAMHEEGTKAKDILGRVYEYFLGGFAGSEGKRGGEFYTPRSVVRVLTEMLEPFPDKSRGIEGRVYDPCCGSGGMFVQAERFVETHGGRLGDIAIYGQESNYTTWRLAKMNLAVRGIDADIRWNNEGSFHKDELKDLRFDYILANPPFNVSDWGGERLREDARWKYGVPLWPMPTTHGYSTSSGTCHRTAQQVWFWRTAQCRPTSPAKTSSAALWSRPTSSTVWWHYRPNFSTPRKSQPAFGSLPEIKTPVANGVGPLRRGAGVRWPQTDGVSSVMLGEIARSRTVFCSNRSD